MRIVEIKPAPTLDSAASFPRLELANLFNIAQWQHEIPWQPFRDGLDIYQIYGDATSGPSAALIRFNKASKVPFHTHPGFEHILVLTGGQRDQNGEITPGTFIVNPPGSTHSVVSEAGCIVLAIYEKPVAFMEDEPSAGLP